MEACFDVHSASCLFTLVALVDCPDDSTYYEEMPTFPVMHGIQHFQNYVDSFIFVFTMSPTQAHMTLTVWLMSRVKIAMWFGES